jgi:hypothetical protein
MTQDRDGDQIEALNELRIILTDLFDKDKELVEFMKLLKLLKESKVERYSWFAEHSTYGKNCTYAKRARDIFKKFEEEKIRKKIVEIYDKFIKVEVNE